MKQQLSLILAVIVHVSLAVCLWTFVGCCFPPLLGYVLSFVISVA